MDCFVRGRSEVPQIESDFSEFRLKETETERGEELLQLTAFTNSRVSQVRGQQRGWTWGGGSTVLRFIKKGENIPNRPQLDFPLLLRLNAPEDPIRSHLLVLFHWNNPLEYH